VAVRCRRCPAAACLAAHVPHRAESVSAVQRWCRRAASQRLDRLDQTVRVGLGGAPHPLARDEQRPTGHRDASRREAAHNRPGVEELAVRIVLTIATAPATPSEHVAGAYARSSSEIRTARRDPRSPRADVPHFASENSVSQTLTRPFAERDTQPFSREPRRQGQRRRAGYPDPSGSFPEMRMSAFRRFRPIGGNASERSPAAPFRRGCRTKVVDYLGADKATS
jgi:hypothetical protein